MEVVLAAIKAAILSCKEELATIAGEEENAQVYLHGLAKRRAKITQDLAELEAHLKAPEEGGIKSALTVER